MVGALGMEPSQPAQRRLVQTGFSCFDGPPSLVPGSQVASCGGRQQAGVGASWGGGGFHTHPACLSCGPSEQQLSQVCTPSTPAPSSTSLKTHSSINLRLSGGQKKNYPSDTLRSHDYVTFRETASLHLKRQTCPQDTPTPPHPQDTLKMTASGPPPPPQPPSA